MCSNLANHVVLIREMCLEDTVFSPNSRIQKNASYAKSLLSIDRTLKFSLIIVKTNMRETHYRLDTQNLANSEKIILKKLDIFRGKIDFGL